MIVGLTGGIGSGKTTVASIFKHLGIPVFIADEEAKKLLEQDTTLQQELANLLGAQLIKNGEVDKAYMAQKIFSNKNLLQKVNHLIHPAVAVAFKKWFAQQNAPYVLREAAILFESGSHKDCDKVVVVTAPESIRLERVIKRSGETLHQVKRRIDQQWPQEKKDQVADYLIKNYGDFSLIEQVLNVHESLLGLAQKS